MCCRVHTPASHTSCFILWWTVRKHGIISMYAYRTAVGGAYATLPSTYTRRTQCIYTTYTYTAYTYVGRKLLFFWFLYPQVYYVIDLERCVDVAILTGCALRVCNIFIYLVYHRTRVTHIMCIYGNAPPRIACYVQAVWYIPFRGSSHMKVMRVTYKMKRCMYMHNRGTPFRSWTCTSLVLCKS